MNFVISGTGFFSFKKNTYIEDQFIGVYVENIYWKHIYILKTCNTAMKDILKNSDVYKNNHFN